LPKCDVVHVRAPANIALIAALLLVGSRSPRARWVKYAGNWQPDQKESPSYTLQRWLLGKGVTRSFVTVNGEWNDQPSWVRRFENPSLDASELADGRRLAEGKRLAEPIDVLFVGRVETPKGAGRAIETLARVVRRGIDARLTLIGDGHEKADFEELARKLGLANRVTFEGWRPPDAIKVAYARAHFLLLPTRASEGWPKVLSEGMAFGAVPLAGAVSSIPYYLQRIGAGRALPPEAIAAFADAIEAYVRAPESWARESKRAFEAAHWFSFEHYLESVDRLLVDLGIGPQ
jgi:glycosyltransferase involved in cell wall biosynthesis